ncbi:MAG: RrF2 family transcriptional regulator [Acidobacteriota bacterium]
MNRGDRYRIEALVELAAVFPAALTVAEVARRRSIPEAFLARLLGALRRAGVLATVRGPGGGVRLARPPQGIALSDVLPIATVPVGDGGPAAWLHERLATERRRVLGALTIADLHAVERTQAGIPDFDI